MDNDPPPPPPPPPRPPPPPLPVGWTEENQNGQVYYANCDLGVSQWDKPTAIPGSLYYKYDGVNGVAPDEFEGRVVATNILQVLPPTMQAARNRKAIVRVLLHGPPTSGKSSIMGHLYVNLVRRYSPARVYYVQAFALNRPQLRDAVCNAIALVENCVVLLDDAHEWYNFKDFFGLFKGTGRLLVAAATYSAEQINETTPVDFPCRVEACLTRPEITSFLGRLGVPQEHHDQMIEWFGDIYGRYYFLVPPLLERWKTRRQKSPTATLADTFFSAATMADPSNARHLPVLSEKFRQLLVKVWKGTANNDECASLIPYGILKENNEWSCEYVRRKYFHDVFQVANPITDLFNGSENLPHELELARTGLRGINWNQLRMSEESSESLFPVEDIWQAEFYGSIGQHIPRQYVFCKEYATFSGSQRGSVDFVLRNGETRAIEFLIKSDRVGLHHERFEKGAYRSLSLSWSYLVVDIKPWGNMPDILEVSEQHRLDIATACFLDPHVQKGARRFHHAVFLVSNGLSMGMLFIYDPETNRAKLTQVSGRV